MSSGATTSAGRAKKDGGRWERVVAMGVAWGWVEAIGEFSIKKAPLNKGALAQ